jgi:hypothetical protein
VINPYANGAFMRLTDVYQMRMVDVGAGHIAIPCADGVGFYA